MIEVGRSRLQHHPPDQRLTRILRRRLADAFNTLFDPERPGGMAAAVVTADGRWSVARGSAGDGRPLDPGATFAIASATKSIVGAQVLLLVAKGRMALDTPIASYLPRELGAVSNGATVRQVLSMRSGVPEHVTEEYLADVLRHPARRWRFDEVLTWVPKSPTFAAGARVEYCNTNYILAGAAIESVTGRTLATALRRGVLARAALPRLFLQGGQRPLPPLALPHSDFPGFPAAEHVLRRGGGLLPTRSLATAAWAAGGMAADAPALAAWGFVLYGGFVLPPEQISLMAEVDAETEYSIGTMHLGEYGLDAIGHPGRIPGYASILAVAPRLRAAVAVLVNSDAPVPADVAGALLATID